MYYQRVKGIIIFKMESMILRRENFYDEMKLVLRIN